MSLQIIAWHDRTSANHQQELNAASAQGYRTLSLSVYGDVSDPRYASVMIKRPIVITTHQEFNLNATQFQAKFNEMAAQGMGPYLVSATGPSNNPLFAVCFKAVSPTPLTRFGINAQELEQINDQQMQNGGILRSIDAYGTPNDVRYIAVWYPNTERVNWNCEGDGDDFSTAQQRFNAITAAEGRPAIVSVLPDGRMLQCFVDTTIGSWASQGNMTSQQYQDAFNKNAAKGLSPICVAVGGSGTNTRFAAIFGSREEVDQRVFTAKGPTTVQEINDAMMKYLKGKNIRHASLAVTKGTRLIYTQGYTWAEPGYPAALPTTLFRQASVSKTIAALAMYQILEEMPTKYFVDTPIQSILNLKTLDNKSPVDPRFGLVTIRHLLESTSAIDRGGIWQDVATANALGGLSHLPVNAKQIASYVASLKLESTTDDAGNTTLDTPGDIHNVKYNNTAYFLLSQVVATIRQAASFEAAITPKLLTPLGITRIRESRSLRAIQDPQEAHYQLRSRVWHEDKDDPKKITTFSRAFAVGASVRTPDMPLVASQYGTWSSENHDGAGGLSAAVTDIARIVAMFSSGEANPVLKSSTLNTMLSRAAYCSSNYSSKPKNKNEFHGFHGFDGVKTLDAFNSIYEGAKGGSLDASQNGYHFVTGGYGYLICIGSNDNAPDDPIMDWEGTIRPIVEGKGKDWDTTDLFTDPSIEMAPLVPVAKKSLEVKEPAFKITPAFSIAEAIRLNQKETAVSLTPPMPIGKQSV